MGRLSEGDVAAGGISTGRKTAIILQIGDRCATLAAVAGKLASRSATDTALTVVHPFETSVKSAAHRYTLVVKES